MKYTTYVIADGRILSGVLDGDDTTASRIAPELALIECLHENGDDPDLYYVAGGAIAERPPMPCVASKTAIVADGTDTATISAIPNPAECEVSDANGRWQYTITDGVLDLTADEAQAISVTIRVWPYRDWTATVTAT